MTQDETKILTQLTKKINDIHVVLLGIEGTEDNGLCGDFSEIKRDIKYIDKRSRANAIQVAGFYGVTMIVITILLHLMGIY